MKAGPVEYGDIFVINKADREGASRVATVLRDYVSDAFEGRSYTPEILLSTATEGDGISEIYKQCWNFIDNLKKSGNLKRRRRNQYFSRVRNNVRDELERRFWTEDVTGDLEKLISDDDQRTRSPSDTARRLIPKEH